MDATTTPVTIYVLLGQRDSVQEGNVLNIISRGDPIVVAGETVGFNEKPLGTAESTRVQNDRFSVATMKTTVPGQQP